MCGAVQQVRAVNPSSAVSFDYLKGYIGRHLFDLFADVIPDPTQDRMDDMLAQYRKVYLAREHSLTRVYPGVVEGLTVLGGRKGTATTKGRPTTRAFLDQYGLIQHLHNVHGSDGFLIYPAPVGLF